MSVSDDIQARIPAFDSADFRAHVFEKSVLHIPNALQNTEFDGVFSRDEVSAMVFFGNMHASEIEAIGPSGVHRDQTLFNPRGFLNASKAKALFERGFHFRLLGVHKRDAFTYRISQLLSKAFSTIVPANAYVSPPQSQGFGPHYDPHDVIVLQTGGRKVWSIFASDQGTPALPLQSQNFVKERHESLSGDKIEEFVLNEGDLLYIPRGVFHAARSGEVASIHLTFGIRPPTWASVLDGFFDKLYKDKLIFRKAIIADGDLEGDFEQVRAEIRRALDSVRPEDVMPEPLDIAMSETSDFFLF